MPRRTRQHGFTIVELMVTVGILGLMLFLINQIFQQTSVAVTTSVQASKTIATSRSINEQLSNDAERMVGPGDPLTESPGYIVIYQRRFTAVPMRDPQTLGELDNDVQLRADQVVFVRDAEGLKSMTPESTSSYGTDLAGVAGDRARVWYGHVQRTKSDGTVLTGANPYLGGANARLDRIGSNWILGRQALLFNPTDQSLATPAKLSALSGYTHADGFYYNSTVSGSGYGTGAALYLGLSDVTEQDYSSLLFAVSDTTTAASHNTNYLGTLYRFSATRLRVNPAPDVGQTDYDTWAIAQGHPILAQNCSEVVVDFAADLNGNGRIDRAFGGTTNDNSGAIYWYDGLKQSNLGDGSGSTTGWTNQTAIPQPFVNLNANAKAFIFRVNDDQPYDTATGGTQAHSYWPYLIRIRYRLHDTRGRLSGNYADALRDGLDNDGDGATDETGEDRISGRWFERIIRVNRPDAL